MAFPFLSLQQQQHSLSPLTKTISHQEPQIQRLQNPHLPHLSQPDNNEKDPLEAILRFRKLVSSNRGLTKLDFAPAIKVCSRASALLPGKQIHAQSIKHSLSSDVYVQTSLLTMYSACGELEDAIYLFEKMPERNVVSWTAMIDAFLHSDQPERALAVFHDMQMAGVEPDCFTMVSVVSACAQLGVLILGRWVHAYIKRGGLEFNVFIGTALVDMYCKCGSVDDALEVFNCIEKKSIQTWNAMLHGFSINGRGAESIRLFKEMEINSVHPNEVTFVALLCGCSHSGLVEEGRFYFDVMQKKYNIKPTVKHYGCMVDLLGRTGLLGQALEMVTEMQIPPNDIVWGSLLNACRIHNNVSMAEHVIEKFNRTQEDHPHSDTSHYVIMSNMYLQAGLEEKMAKVRMKVGRKPMGSSWVEIGRNVYEFAVGKASHPMWGKIKEMLIEVTEKVRRENPNQGQEAPESTHSEKVAVAFALLTTSVSTPIRIAKNLRICRDCHDTMKLISEVYEREIIVRDCTRFHQFIGGLCSCKDYW